MTRFYMDSVNGSDSNSGLAGAPWKTMTQLSNQFGVSVLSGDDVQVEPGTYTNRLIVNNFAPASRVRIFGRTDSPVRPIILSNNTQGVLIATASRISITGLELQRPTATPDANVQVSGTCDAIIIESCTIKDAITNGFHANGTGTPITNLIVRDCVITNAGADGVGGNGTVTGFLVKACTIDKCGDATYAGGNGDGVSWHEDCDGIIEDCYIRRCSKGGVTNVHRSGHIITVRRCFISDCVRWGIKGHRNGADTMGNHEWYANTVLMADSGPLFAGQPCGIYASGDLSAINEFLFYGNLVVNPVNDATTFGYGSVLFETTKCKVTARNNYSYTLQAAGRHWCVPDSVNWLASGTTINYNGYNDNSNPKFVYDTNAVFFNTGGPPTNWVGMGFDVNGGIVSPNLISVPTPPGLYNWATDANRWPAGTTADDFFPSDASGLPAGGVALPPPYNVDFRGNTVGNPPGYGPIGRGDRDHPYGTGRRL